MELIQGTGKSSKFEPQDFISCMPNDVVSNILDRLPLQDAVRTGILAKYWRFKWTMLSQLVFDENFFKYLIETKGENNYGRIISRLLAHLKGAITKFVLYIKHQTCPVLDDGDINNWILILSRNGIKDLTFRKVNGPQLKLPTHIFSCLELKHLKLHNCCFNRPPSFNGFPNLLSLELSHVQFEGAQFGEFITQCPALEILKMGLAFSLSKVKPVEIAKLTNLKVLSLYLCNLDITLITRSGGIFELVGCLPKLQELHLVFISGKFIEDGAIKRFHTTFPCVKTLTFNVGTGLNLSCAFEMIERFPNLQSLVITGHYWNIVPTPGVCLPEVDYSTMGQLQLRSVVFKSFLASEDELCLIKYLLACSPFLKKIVIHLHVRLASDEKLFARKLLKLHRASPVAEIDLC